MGGHRRKLRALFLLLCASQLTVTAIGLGVAYQALHSYSVDIAYEQSLDKARRMIVELVGLARAASPENLELDDATSGPEQLSQVEYASKVFLPKALAVLDEAKNDPKSPFALAQDDLQALVSEMDTVSQQSDLAQQAWAAQDAALARARLTYVDRAAIRAQELLTDIDQDLLHARDDLLTHQSAEARNTRLILLPVSAIGGLLLFPMLLYARRLDRNVMEYETELEGERSLLEVRVAARTAQLRREIEHRKRLETFNANRNRLLEKVAEGNDLHEILVQLTEAIEQSVPGSHSMVMLNADPGCTAISMGVSSDLAVYLETILRRSWDELSGPSSPEQLAVFLKDGDPRTRIRFADVWSQGYHGILAVRLMDSHLMTGLVILLLREGVEADSLAREMLLSASRMAWVALKNYHMQDELFRRAHQDALTSLPNRALFEDRLQQTLARARRLSGNAAVLCIDLDGFKEINDRYGHGTGDWLLQQVAQRLTSFIRAADTVARIGGDEFVIAIGDIRQREDLANICQALVYLLAEPYSFEGVTFRSTASVGAAIFPADGDSGEELRRHADLAMYRAKELGRNTWQIFEAQLEQKLIRRRHIEHCLQEALEHNGFEIHYQPICTISREVVGLEALIRFASPELRSISPAEFIPVAEQSGQIDSLGEWVLREACQQARQWREEGLALVPIAVNVSSLQFGRRDFADRVSRILEEAGLAADCLYIEITETAVMSNFEEGRRQICALAELGIHISVDDFGTGQSSLSYLHCLPIKSLKIDRSFVQQMVNSRESKAIVRAIIAMAQSLELSVVAEGVETESQLDALAAAGCTMAQGYLFSRPVDHVAATAFLKAATIPVLNPVLSRA